MSSLIKQQKVFDRHPESRRITDLADEIVFVQVDNWNVLAAFTMCEQDWRDMGSPEQVTVTIQAGDLLNDTYAEKIAGTRVDPGTHDPARP